MKFCEAHTTRPNKYLQHAGVVLGLSREQVNTPNFGWHTVNAIKAELQEKNHLSLSLEEAFAKYRDLDNIQVGAMTGLGLSREQVETPNFGCHTVDAIKDIKKRTKELSTDEAFEMVNGKSIRDTLEFIESYLEATKKAQKPIAEMDLIRVVVNIGGGFGHQRAAITLMQKLREMGFTGVFDIQCDDRLDANLMSSETGEMYRNWEPLVSRRLKGMIPGFESSESNQDGIRTVSGLGAVKMSSLPHDYLSRGDLGLQEADLAVCAADDTPNFPIVRISDTEIKPRTKTFNAALYISLEPTDWHQGSCFVIDKDGVVTELPPASTMRLSSAAAFQLPDISSIPLSATEQRIIDITSNAGINSQLVYGLYPGLQSGSMKESGKLDQTIEICRIVTANILLSQKTGMPSILLLPQKIASEVIESLLDNVFINENSKIHFVNLRIRDLDIGTYRADDVIVAHTGHLQQAVFDHLMLQGTTLPPVIEGCNSRETCESAGRPFIHGSGKYDPLKQYEVRSVDKQELHTQASLCLEQGDREYVPQLVQYMQESLVSNPKFITYHVQRRESFFTRPDACEVAFDTLGIKYEEGLLQEVRKRIKGAMGEQPRIAVEHLTAANGFRGSRLETTKLGLTSLDLKPHKGFGDDSKKPLLESLGVRRSVAEPPSGYEFGESGKFQR